MPFYQQLIVTMPKFSKEALVGLFKRHSKLVIENGGVVRGIEHHGIRPLPERATRKYASVDGSRHFWEARFITSSFDANPKCLIELDRMLRNEEGVLRYFTEKKNTTIDKVNSKSYRNPYLEKVEKV